MQKALSPKLVALIQQDLRDGKPHRQIADDRGTSVGSGANVRARMEPMPSTARTSGSANAAAPSS